MMKAYQSELALLNHLPGMAYRCELIPERRLLFASEGCLALTGFTATELTADGGMAYRDLIHGEDRALVQLEIETALQEKRPYHCIYRLITADQQERWVRESGQGIFAENGKLIALEGFVTDAHDPALASNVMRQRVADLTRKLSAVHDILEALSTPAELPTILQKSLNAALVAAQGDAGFIHLREESGRSMRLVVQQGMPDTVIETIATISGEDGLVAWVAQNSKPLHIPSIVEDPRTVYLADSGVLKVYVGVPISREQRVWGTLSVLGRNPSQFSGEEVAFLTSVGEEIGMVLENARLHRQADRLLLVQERNRLARELHDSVTQSLYSVTLFAEAGRRTASVQGNAEAVDYFTQIGETGQQALKEMRLLIYRLRPPILAEEGLVRALQQRLNSVEGRAGVKGQLFVEGEAALSPSL
jgi:PAS domain S-box-containing protein